MTTPTGTITLLNVQDEFGGSVPIGINEYYAGGAYVPAGTAGVPSSGTISMNDLRGKSKATPLTFFVTPNTVAEGSSFYVFAYNSGTIYPTIYWKLTNYTNLDDADFNAVSGSVSYDYIDGDYPQFSVTTVADSNYEGTGTFNITFYSNPARTTSIGSTQYLSVVDTYSTSMVAPSTTTIYRYANRNPGYRTSVVYMDSSGLVGSTVYYEVYTDSGSLTSVDVDAPTSLTGTLIVPAGGRVGITVRSTEWDGSQSVTTDKNVYVRFRLNNSSGSILGTSSAMTLKAMPVVSFSFSPTTIREGQASTLTGSVTNIPYDGGASFFWRQAVFSSAQSSDWVNVSGDPGNSTGELIWNTQIVSTSIYGALDSLAESQEELYFYWCLNSSNGTAIWFHGLSILSPAQITSVTGSYNSAQITNISSYPAARNFDVTFYADYALNIAPSVTVPANQISSNAISPFLYTATEGTVGTYIMEYIFTNPYHEQKLVFNNSESFIFPVYGVEFFFTGANAPNTARTLIARITSVPSVYYSRDFTVEFAVKLSTSSTFNPYAAIPGNVPLTVAGYQISCANTILYSTTSTSTQFDFQFKVTRSGHETKYSPVFYNVYL